MADPPWTPPPSGHRALADRLGGAAVDPDSETVVHRRPAPPTSSRGNSRGWLLATAIAALVVAAGAGYVAYDNKNRAADWEARAFRLERNTEQLNGLLVERSTQLNERTRELNAIASKVTRQQNALTRSESDVETLSDRQ